MGGWLWLDSVSSSGKSVYVKNLVHGILMVIMVILQCQTRNCLVITQLSNMETGELNDSELADICNCCNYFATIA